MCRRAKGRTVLLTATRRDKCNHYRNPYIFLPEIIHNNVTATLNSRDVVNAVHMAGAHPP